MSERPELEVLVRWEHLVGELLDRTQRFPKAVRFTFAGRIDNAVLSVKYIPATATTTLRHRVDSIWDC